MYVNLCDFENIASIPNELRKHKQAKLYIPFCSYSFRDGGERCGAIPKIYKIYDTF